MFCHSTGLLYLCPRFKRLYVMELPKDPVMLLSVINTELRDKYPCWTHYAKTAKITKTSITDTLKGIDYEYDNIRNQFV